jgi:ATP-dependent Clp protease protease subunit
MNDDKFESRKPLEEYGIFPLSGEIDDRNVDDAIRFILESNLDGSFDHLTLIVNSPGGFVSCGFALIDVMAGSRLPIHTVGLGQISSMGLTIFIAGSFGHRILTPNTLIMSHQWSGERWGKEHELIAQQKQDEIVSKQMMRHYVKCTKMSEKDVRKYLFPANDVFLTAQEAKKLNICDIDKEFGQCFPKTTSGSKKTVKK